MTPSASPESVDPAERPSATPPSAGTGSKTPPAEAKAGTKPKAKAKPPAPEDKPFDQFVPELLVPALERELQARGANVTGLCFEGGSMPVVGGDCWMVKGTLPGERRFWLCFTGADIRSPKMVALAEGGTSASLLESFLIDEKRMTLPLIVSRLVQRLNGQKWLGPN